MAAATQREVTYSVEHFYPKHPGHPLAPAGRRNQTAVQQSQAHAQGSPQPE